MFKAVSSPTYVALSGRITYYLITTKREYWRKWTWHNFRYCPAFYWRVLRSPRKSSVSQTVRQSDIVPEFRTPDLHITKLSYPLSRSIRHFCTVISA